MVIQHENEHWTLSSLTKLVRMNGNDNKLVKFAKPLIVDEIAISATDEATESKSTKSELSKMAVASSSKGKEEIHLPPINANKVDDKDELQSILDSILPPKQWQSDGKSWKQSVSTTPATRLDVINLHHKVGALLKERQAKEYGLCPIRRELYDQLFDELIRQVTINCAERGLMLMRIRDELQMSLCTYQSVLESSVAFGIRKSLKAEKMINESGNITNIMKKELEGSKDKIHDLNEELNHERAIQDEEKRLTSERFKEEIERLKGANQQLKNQLFALLESDTVEKEEFNVV